MLETKANFTQIARQYDNEPISANQLKFIRDLMEKQGITVGDIITDGFPPLERLTKGIATELLEYLKNPPKVTQSIENIQSNYLHVDLTMCHCFCHRMNEAQRAIVKVKNCNLCSCEIIQNSS